MEKRSIGKTGKGVLILLVMISMAFGSMACGGEDGTEKMVVESTDDSKQTEGKSERGDGAWANGGKRGRISLTI